MADYYAATGGTETVCVNITSLNPAGTLAIAQGCASDTDNLYANRGDTFTDNLNINWDGVLGTPVIIGAYGTGLDPKLRSIPEGTNAMGIRASFVTLQDWDALGSGASPCVVFKDDVNFREDITIKDSYIENPSGHPQNQAGLSAKSVDGLELNNLTVIGRNNGIVIEGSLKKIKNTQTIDCDSTCNSNDSLTLHEADTYGLGDNHTVTRGFFWGAGEDGLDSATRDLNDFSYSSNVTFEGAICYDNGFNGVLWGHTGDTLFGYALTCYNNNQLQTTDQPEYAIGNGSNAWHQSLIIYNDEGKPVTTTPVRLAAFTCLSANGTGNKGALVNSLLENTTMAGANNALLELWGRSDIAREYDFINNIFIGTTGNPYIRQWSAAFINSKCGVITNYVQVKDTCTFTDNWYTGSTATTFLKETTATLHDTNVTFATWQGTYGFDTARADQDENPGLNFTGNKRSRTTPDGAYFKYISTSSAGAQSGTIHTDPAWDGLDILGDSYVEVTGVDVGPYNITESGANVTATITGVSGAGAPGTVGVVSDIPVPVTGVSGTGEAGTPTVTGDVVIEPISVIGQGLLGSVMVRIRDPLGAGDFNVTESVPEQYDNTREWVRQISVAVNRVIEGKVNPTGEFTLTVSTTTTTVTDFRVGEGSVVIPQPITASAVAEVGSTYIETIDTANNTFTVTHASNSIADRKFRYVILG